MDVDGTRFMDQVANFGSDLEHLQAGSSEQSVHFSGFMIPSQKEESTSRLKKKRKSFLTHAHDTFLCKDNVMLKIQTLCKDNVMLKTTSC